MNVLQKVTYYASLAGIVAIVAITMFCWKENEPLRNPPAPICEHSQTMLYYRQIPMENPSKIEKLTKMTKWQTEERCKKCGKIVRILWGER